MAAVVVAAAAAILEANTADAATISVLLPSLAVNAAAAVLAAAAISSK